MDNGWKLTGVCVSALLVLSFLVVGCGSKQYSLTLAVNGNGSTSPSAGTYSYKSGESLTLVASPTPGWKFDGWGGDASGASSSTSLNMDRNKSVTANFSKITYILTLSVNGSGTSNPAPGGHSYDAGTPVKISATPGQGWSFSGWTGDMSSALQNSTILMNSDKAVTANFYRPSLNVGPLTKDIGTGTGDFVVSSLYQGDRVDFTFSAAGSLVYYSVIDPNGSVILNGSSGNKVQSGQGSFTATASGNYRIHFVSSGVFTPSVLTVNYVVSYPATGSTSVPPIKTTTVTVK